MSLFARSGCGNNTGILWNGPGTRGQGRRLAGRRTGWTSIRETPDNEKLQQDEEAISRVLLWLPYNPKGDLECLDSNL